MIWLAALGWLAITVIACCAVLTAFEILRGGLPADQGEGRER